MSDPRHVAVIDIGKTNAKLVLVDLATRTEIDLATRPNVVLPGPPWPHFDVEGHWAFLLEALARFHRTQGVDAISVTTHGASLALLDETGRLAAPILDYEHDGPQGLREAYEALRPPFSETGSPALANGLNAGAQLHWMLTVDPGLRDRIACILPYPQYWSHRLTGVAASDVTSLGCHTDLWEPRADRFSALVDRLGLAGRAAPPRRPADVLGPILPEIADATGLPPSTPVSCGIHDSNASLLPHILGPAGPLSVVSTGTWVVAMSIGGGDPLLDPNRDTLLNVDALGRAVPSARFMGGREFEIITGGRAHAVGAAEGRAVIARGLMLLPAVEPATGPFRGRTMRWLPHEPAAGSDERLAALAFYLALMTAECLHLTGGAGPIHVEGPFAHNRLYLDMLHAATGRPVFRSAAATGTGIGAALLCAGDRQPAVPSEPVPASDATPSYASYATHWHRALDRT